MSKQKSIFVTAIIAVMLAVITFAAYRLSMPAFIGLVSAMYAVGFVSSTILFCKWLEKEPARKEEVIEPPPVNSDADFEVDDDFISTYEQIKEEMEAEE